MELRAEAQIGGRVASCSANLTGGPDEAQNVVNRHFKPLLVRADLPQ